MDGSIFGEKEFQTIIAGQVYVPQLSVYSCITVVLWFICPSHQTAIFVPILGREQWNGRFDQVNAWPRRNED